MKAIFGNKLAPSLADRYLARTAYASQQHDGPQDPDRPFNLWQPVGGDHGAHGDFDGRARTDSVELWLETHPGWVAVGALGIMAALAGLIKKAEPKPELRHKQAA